MPRKGLTPEKFRRHRGLLFHDNRNRNQITQAPNYRRRRIDTFPYRSGKPGTCSWCETPTQGKAWWHKECIAAYLMAIGSIPRVDGRIVIETPDSCALCGCKDFLELDHRDALALARTSKNWKHLLRAYTVENLQWNCANCHRLKTTQDMAKLREMKNVQNGQLALFLKDPHA